MKLFLLFTFLLLTVHLPAQWRIKYDGIDPNNEVRGASFISPSTGYIGTPAWIGFTTDSGQTVQKRYVTLANVNFNNYPVNVTFGFSLEDVYAFSADTLLVSGDYALEPAILYSTNGGATWLMVFHRLIPINTVNIYNGVWQMEFPGRGSIGYAVHGDQVLKTTNRGQTWQVVRDDNNQELFDISFINTQTGFAAGPNRLLKTTNGGATWSVLSVPFGIRQIFAYSDQYVFINTTNGDNFYSSNGGSSWTQANASIMQIGAYDMHYVNDSTGYIGAGAIYQTRNRGKSWELMHGSENTSWVNRLRFWNNQIAWACTAYEEVYITSNGGGISHPRALFTVNSSMVCTNSTVQLINQSHLGYGYQWFRNSVLFATTYNASYIAGGTPDTIKLVVNNGIETDTLSEYVNATGSATLTINGAARNDSVCSGGPVVFDIFNSRTDVLYQVGRPCCGYTLPVNGNGGTLTLSFGTNSTEDSSSTFTISGYVNGNCGYQTASTQDVVRIIRSDPPATTATDTICTQAPFMITILNTKIGYKYWADPSYPKVNGNGASIQVPCRFVMSIQNVNLDPDGTLVRHMFPIYTQNIALGCGGQYPITNATMIGRRTIANFEVLGHDWMTGDNLKFKNISKRGETWLWRFPDGGNSATSTMAEPTIINYGSVGMKIVKLISTTHEGCTDSSNRAIEIFSGTGTVPLENTCPGTVGNIVDSLRGDRQYYVSRSIYEDEYGNRIISGGYTDMTWLYQFYPTNYEGWFAAKFDKNGQLKWSLRQSTGEDLFTYNPNSHIIVEQAIGDSLGYTFLFGHSLNRIAITANGNESFLIPKNCAFLMRVSPAGKILWVKSFYNRFAFTDEVMLDYGAGSILRGKSDEIYLFTHRHPGNRFFMNNTMLYNYNEGLTGVILQFDANGVIKRKKSYPITENNMRRFATQTSNSYDSLARARWAAGKLVLYGVLNSTEMSGNSIDGVVIPFNTTTIKSALLFFDTTNLQVTSIRPLYRNTSSGLVSIPLETYTVDDNGNYFASYSAKLPILFSSLAAQFDTLKPKSFISGYTAAGTLTWTKQTEGLQPKSMEIASGQLKVAGTNYTYAGFSNGGIIGSTTQSPTLLSVNKLTFIGDVGSYSGIGKYGLGTLDLTVASFDPSTGNVLKLQQYGSAKEDESTIMSKGYGAQMWMVGTVGMSYRNVPERDDSTSTIYTYKIAADNNCLATYEVLPAFLRWDLGENIMRCIDSTYKLAWSSNGTGPVDLAFSLNNGNTYTSIASSVPASAGIYNFNAVQAGALGSVLFKISDAVTGFSDTARMLLVKKVTPDVTITASATSIICGGNTTINFTATPVNGGSAPSFQWFVDNQFVGTNSPNFSFSSFTNGSQVKVVMNSNDICLTRFRDTSNVISITVIPSVTPDVTITSSATASCNGTTTINFTATPVNGGTAPIYQWFVNNQVAGTSSPGFSYASFTNGTQVKVVMTSNAPCLITSKDTSNIISISVTASITPGVSISGNTTVTQGQSTQVTAVPVNGGAAPVYQWQDSTATHSWQNIAGANSSTYNYSPAATGNKIRCNMTSNAPCASPSVTVSPALSFTVNAVTAVPPVPGNQFGIHLYPNPSSATITIDTLKLSDRWETLDVITMDGKHKPVQMNIRNRQRVELDIRALPAAMYVVVLRRKTGVPAYIKFVKQ